MNVAVTASVLRQRRRGPDRSHPYTRSDIDEVIFDSGKGTALMPAKPTLNARLASNRTEPRLYHRVMGGSRSMITSALIAGKRFGEQECDRTGVNQLSKLPVCALLALCQQLTRCHRAAPRQKLARFVRCARDLRWALSISRGGSCPRTAPSGCSAKSACHG
jgi:hypothetical protein